MRGKIVINITTIFFLCIFTSFQTEFDITHSVQPTKINTNIIVYLKPFGGKDLNYTRKINDQFVEPLQPNILQPRPGLENLTEAAIKHATSIITIQCKFIDDFFTGVSENCTFYVAGGSEDFSNRFTHLGMYTFDKKYYYHFVFKNSANKYYVVRIICESSNYLSAMLSSLKQCHLHPDINHCGIDSLDKKNTLAAPKIYQNNTQLQQKNNNESIFKMIHFSKASQKEFQLSNILFETIFAISYLGLYLIHYGTPYLIMSGKQAAMEKIEASSLYNFFYFLLCFIGLSFGVYFNYCEYVLFYIGKFCFNYIIYERSERYRHLVLIELFIVINDFEYRYILTNYTGIICVGIGLAVRLNSNFTRNKSQLVLLALNACLFIHHFLSMRFFVYNIFHEFLQKFVSSRSFILNWIESYKFLLDKEIISDNYCNLYLSCLLLITIYFSIYLVIGASGISSTNIKFAVAQHFDAFISIIFFILYAATFSHRPAITNDKLIFIFNIFLFWYAIELAIGFTFISFYCWFTLSPEILNIALQKHLECKNLSLDQLALIKNYPKNDSAYYALIIQQAKKNVSVVVDKNQFNAAIYERKNGQNSIVTCLHGLSEECKIMYFDEELVSHFDIALISYVPELADGIVMLTYQTKKQEIIEIQKCSCPQGMIISQKVGGMYKLEILNYFSQQQPFTKFKLSVAPELSGSPAIVFNRNSSSLQSILYGKYINGSEYLAIGLNIPQKLQWLAIGLKNIWNYHRQHMNPQKNCKPNAPSQYYTKLLDEFYQSARYIRSENQDSIQETGTVVNQVVSKNLQKNNKNADLLYIEDKTTSQILQQRVNHNQEGGKFAVKANDTKIRKVNGRFISELLNYNQAYLLFVCWQQYMEE